MNDVIRRNMPVLIIGLVTLVVFTIIIVLAQRNPVNQPKLIQIDESKLITEHTYFQGPEDAPLTLVEFSNYNCPHCANAHPYVQSLIDASGGALRWGIRHLPFNSDPTSFKAAVAAQAAGRQGKFWEYSQKLYENQSTFTDDNLKKYAQELGLDMIQFEKDFADNAIAQEVTTDRDYALSSGVSGTPTFILNGKHVELSEVVNQLGAFVNTQDNSGDNTVTVEDDGTTQVN